MTTRDSLRWLGFVVGLSGCDTGPPSSNHHADTRSIESASAHWMATSSETTDWGRAILLFSDQSIDCDELPEHAPGLGALWREEPIQGTGTGTLVWLQWLDLDDEIHSWEGRFLFGESPISARTQRRAVQVPFTRGVPQFDRTGRHGSIRILSIENGEVSGTIESDQLEGSFRARACGPN